MYYYNIIIGLSNEGDISDLFKLSLNLVKINSVESLKDKIYPDFFSNLLNFNNSIFKDSYFNKIENDCRWADIDRAENESKKLIEYKKYIKIAEKVDEVIKYRNKYDYNERVRLYEQDTKLRNEWSKKISEFRNYEPSMNAYFKKLSYHLY
jgi:hypothetical protein